MVPEPKDGIIEKSEALMVARGDLGAGLGTLIHSKSPTELSQVELQLVFVLCLCPPVVPYCIILPFFGGGFPY